MTTDLETHLQDMGGALRGSVGSPPPRRVPTPGRTRMVVGVPLVAVAALAAGLSVQGGDGGPGPIGPDPVVNLRGLIPETAPEGLELGWAGQQVAGVASTPDGDVAGAGAINEITAGPVDLSTYLYGQAGVDTPFAADDLVVNAWEAAPGAQAFDPAALAAGLPGSVVATVDGAGAVVCDVAVCATDALPAVSSVTWQTTGGVQAVAASQSLTVDELLQIVEGLTVEAGDTAGDTAGDAVDGIRVTLGALPATVDGALEEVAHLEDTVVDGAREVDAYWLGYVDAADPTRALDVTTLTGSADDLTALVWSLGATELVELRGLDAFLAIDEAGDKVELVWQEADGVLAHVTALGMSRDEVLAVVDGLRWVADDEWQEVQELAAAAQGALGGVDADAGATADGSGADASADVDAAGADASVDADAGGDGAGVDVGLDTVVTDLEASLHVDLGAAAVVGPVVGAVEDGVEDLAEELPPPPTMPGPPPTAPGLLP